jgi:integral membrane sensor domain MASE1
LKNTKKIAIAAVLAIAFALTFLSKAVSLPKTAGYTPKILIAIVILLSVLMIVESYYKEKNNIQAKRRIDERSEEDEDPDEDKTPIDYKKAFLFGIMIAIYIFTMKPIGYFIVTPLFVIIAYRFLKSTSWKNTILISAGFTVFVYLLFVLFLKLPVPMGILG